MKAKHENKVCSSQKARKFTRKQMENQAFDTLQQIINERIITWKMPAPSSTLAQLHQNQWGWASSRCFLDLRSLLSKPPLLLLQFPVTDPWASQRCWAEESGACRAGASLGESRRPGNGQGTSARAAKRKKKRQKKKYKLEAVLSEATANF